MKDKQFKKVMKKLGKIMIADYTNHLNYSAEQGKILMDMVHKFNQFEKDKEFILKIIKGIR